MKKEEKLEAINTRVTKDLLVDLEKIEKKTEKSRSEIIRIALKRFIQISNRISEGEVLNYIPYLESLENYRIALTDLEKQLEATKNQATRIVLESVISSLEFKLLDELQKKYPDHKGFFKI